jgi:hypothetical protein
MQFDPDKYLKEKATREFNPDEYIKNKTSQDQNLGQIPTGSSEIAGTEALSWIGDKISGIGSSIKKGATETSEAPIETALDAGIGVAQGATLDTADELAGAITTAYKKVAEFDTRDASKIYTEVRDLVRDRTKLARTRSPIATFVGELIGQAANPVTRAGGLGKTIVTSGIEGAGRSESDDLAGVGAESILTAGIGTAVHSLGKIAKFPFKDPEDIRLRSTGSGIREFKQTGVGDRKAMEKNLRNIGFYSNRKTRKVFDPKTETFVESKKRPYDNGLTEIDILKDRARDSVERIDDEVGKLLYKSANASKIFNAEDLMNDLEFKLRLTDLAKEAKVTDPELKIKYFREAVEPVLNRMNNNGKGVTLLEINELKKDLQNEARKVYDSNVSTTPADEMKGNLANYMRQFIERQAGSNGEKISRLNRTSMHLQNQMEDISRARAGERAAGSGMGSTLGIVNLPYLFGKTAERTAKTSTGGLKRADIGQAFKSIPEKLRTGAEAIMKTGPVQVPYNLESPLMNDSQFIDRSPQSIPEKLIMKRLPRSSEEILANKDLVLLKVAQQMPEIFDTFQDVFNHDPSYVSATLPALVKMAPHMFEVDAYDRVDGKILDPAKRQLAIKDTNIRKDLLKSQKAEIISKLNQTGEF